MRFYLSSETERDLHRVIFQDDLARALAPGVGFEPTRPREATGF